ncbi:hypothetical protein SAMN05192574_102777 [Mucilaginibacter gossypiicola]|uniref:Uncharacterized protein n=1 Tax=Mucilaginibacter gossypiicola TaxID=551995 RepID=A0A1H8EN74_9SPHI|nr:hypothetical protein [Mucilaginibacter gossypiicola]SEN20935.1 hypothetical protein SAMN05192574_102777 [Mucilaginibacter gossypiicola]
MATDGVKIIDGDIAHDTYWGIMDLYDNKVDFELIKEKFPLKELSHFDDFDNEIYITSCALAYWEIGKIDAEMLSLVKKVIDKGGGVKIWAERSINESKARLRELERFWKKISQENVKIRAPKTYRTITNLYFKPDTALTFKHFDGNYRVIICIDIIQHRGSCDYRFVLTTYNANEKPTLDKLSNSEIIGRKMGTGYDQSETRAMQPGIERVWNFEKEEGNCNFLFGVVQFGTSHKNLSSFNSKFESVGPLKILPALKMMGALSGFSAFEDFEAEFFDLEKRLRIFGNKKYPVKVLCDL